MLTVQIPSCFWLNQRNPYFSQLNFTCLDKLTSYCWLHIPLVIIRFIPVIFPRKLPDYELFLVRSHDRTMCLLVNSLVWLGEPRFGSLAPFVVAIASLYKPCGLVEITLQIFSFANNYQLHFNYHISISLLYMYICIYTPFICTSNQLNPLQLPERLIETQEERWEAMKPPGRLSGSRQDHPMDPMGEMIIG